MNFLWLVLIIFYRLLPWTEHWILLSQDTVWHTFNSMLPRCIDPRVVLGVVLGVELCAWLSRRRWLNYSILMFYFYLIGLFHISKKVFWTIIYLNFFRFNIIQRIFFRNFSCILRDRIWERCAGQIRFLRKFLFFRSQLQFSKDFTR